MASETTRSYEHVLSFALEHPWAITRPMLAIVAGIIGRHVAGQHASAAEIAAALADRKNLPQPAPGGAVALIPIHGVIAPRINMLSDISGGTTFEGLSAQLQTAMANKAVKTIVLDIDSPGGSVAGMTEFAREVMAARTKKAVIAQIQYLGASAAYGVASAATEVLAAPSAMVGSVGVYGAHDDVTEALAKLGVKRTYISAGKGKVDTIDGPLGDEAKARMQAVIDDAYGRMVGDVVKGRGKGMTADRVRNEWQAHVYPATEALALGMIDGIATLDDTLERVTGGAKGLSASTTDTTQEPATATVQDRAAAIHWQNAVEAQLLGLGL
jgi:signal peptide peptidase SppA